MKMRAPKDDFTHITTWVFDLDNTLYDPSVRLFDQIELRMTDYVVRTLNVSTREADRLRSEYWAEYGTTLAGLMRVHDIDPDPYLEEVHDISFDALTPDAELRDLITTLPGRRIVYTNGTAPYAENVLKGRGLDGVFDAIYGIEHADYLPKPEQAAFEQVFAKDGLKPAQAAMFEDTHRNLIAPHEMGMCTVYVAPDPHDADHIHHHTGDLNQFLRALV